MELFAKRDFECDCGTTRTPDGAPCSLRSNAKTGVKGGVTGEAARPANKYNQNFGGTFCGCGDVYDPAKEKGTMFQCLGLGHLDSGGCGEDWWHPECLMGLPRQLSTAHPKISEVPAEEEAKIENGAPNEAHQTPTAAQEENTADDDSLPPGFPAEDTFDHLVCYKCVEANPWIKAYAGTEGFLPAVHYQGSTEANAPTAPAFTTTTTTPSTATGSKRKLEDDKDEGDTKRSRLDAVPEEPTTGPAPTPTAPKHTLLPPLPSGTFSIFLAEDFRDHLCRCPTCFPRLRLDPHLLDPEDPYEPPVSESDDQEDNQNGSVGSRSLLDRGEAALSTMDRMRAIEGVMAYNHLRDKVKAFLQPFAESGQAVGAEDVKAYFARLRGDAEAMRAAVSGAGGDNDGGDGRREQSGY